MGLAYYSLIPQMIVTIVALSCVALFDVLRVTVCAAIVSGFTTVLVSGLVPADGNLFDPHRYQHLWPPVALLQTELIGGLRSGSIRMLDLSAMQGIITFPSYHAALAAIFIWAFRAVPGLAGFGAVWAGLTILATPLGGGHYAVDVLAGLLLAVGSLAAADPLVSIGEPRTAQQTERPTRLAHRLRHARDRISAPGSETSR
jgi:membrane-associated phospholipid phosphatase